MGHHPIEFFGITPGSRFPQCPPHHPCTEFCESDKLCIPSQKITSSSIRKICLTLCINSFKTICTPAGKKLVIYGTKQITVFFVHSSSHQGIHSAYFEIPFCTFVLLKNNHAEVIQICSVVEDISVKCLDSRYFTIASIIFVCPVFKKDCHLYPSPLDHSTNSHDKQVHHSQQICTLCQSCENS